MDNYYGKKSFWQKIFTWKLVFIPIGIFIIFFVVQAVGHAVKRFKGLEGSNNKASMHILPGCGNRQELFTSLPVAENQVKSIEPLGGFSPEVFHIFPIKHTYWTGTAANAADQQDVDLHAPADGWMTFIESENYTNATYTDYFVYFSPCQEVEVYFFHIKSLSDKISNEFENPHCYSMDVSGKGEAKRCDKSVKIAVKSGEIIGTVNNKAKGIGQLFDFGMSDSRIPELKFANRNRWTKSGFDLLHMVCAYNYYVPELKTKIFAKIGDMKGENRRTTEPICGEYMQDVIGTAQGVWFHPEDDNNDERKQLTLSNHNVKTTKGIFSVGNSLTNSGIENGAYYFSQKHEGLIDRDFKEVKSDGKNYCYEPRALDGQYQYPFRIILTMPSSTTLKIEGQKTSDCANGPWEFSANAGYFER